ncbi:MAG: sugar ABC transporter permease [Firmicutes bacterium]|nr:sugar ABC transporter permease [Bacillota bacterium]
MAGGRPIKLRRQLPGMIFTLPMLLGIGIFTVYPVIQSFVYSFTDFDGFYSFSFLGLQNYIELFTADRDFGRVMRNTFVYALISIPLGLTLSYLLAVLVAIKLPGVKVYRALFYLPVVIPGIVGAVLWKDVFRVGSPQGAFNDIVMLFGGKPFGFFSQPQTSMFSLILLGLWGVGGGMILWLAALKNIPSSLYEAARIDGAGAFRRFFRITIPMSTPMIFFNVVMGVIGTLQTTSTLAIAPNSGRGWDNSVYFVGVRIYHLAFTSPYKGYASALAWILFAIIALLTAVIFLTSRWVYFGEDA